MKIELKPLPLALLLGFNIQMTQAQTRFDELANLPFSENRPTEETAKILTDELLFRIPPHPNA
jgi:hypothetical protein